MERFVIRIAHKTIAIESRYPLTKKMCSRFLVEDAVAPDAFFSVNEEDVRMLSVLQGDTSPDYAESLYIYKKIGEWLPEQGCFVFHGAAVTFENQGYIFAAPSGTGKSTHIKLWRKHLGDAVGIVNGDKPVISVRGEVPLVCGTPWAGKEDWKRNVCVPVKALCFLKRALENSVRRIAPADCLPSLFNQVYLPEKKEAVALTMEHLNTCLEKVPVFLLQCNMTEDAVRCSFEGLTGLSYNTFRK